MNKLKEYRVAHKGMNEGKHRFRFTLDREFFDCFEATKGTEGEMIANMEIVKHGTFIEVNAGVEGKVNATCDRCLETMELPVRGEAKFLLKQGGRNNEGNGEGNDEGNGNDYIVLLPEDDYIDAGVLLYEMFMLNYPIRVVHPAGECSPEMERVLERFAIDAEPAIDPRWEELKKLIK
ncbi:MAG: DUF177 domain-containing protein [Odoribacteraceae bacterium]|nr:DUF177 domain-containing protein [Odoribacteraceae bacterium]